MRCCPFRLPRDVCGRVHSGLHVVGGVEGAAGAFRDATVRVGKVLLCLGRGYADLDLVSARSGLAIRTTRAALVITPAAAPEISLALALLQLLSAPTDGSSCSSRRSISAGRFNSGSLTSASLVALTRATSASIWASSPTSDCFMRW